MSAPGAPLHPWALSRSGSLGSRDLTASGRRRMLGLAPKRSKKVGFLRITQPAKKCTPRTYFQLEYPALYYVDQDQQKQVISVSAMNVYRGDSPQLIVLRKITEVGPRQVREWVLEADNAAEAHDWITALSIPWIHALIEMGDMVAIPRVVEEDSGAVNDVDGEGRTALHMAVDCNAPEIVKFLLSVRGVRPNHADMQRATALHYAAAQMYNDCLKVLLECQEVDVRVVDKNNDNPLLLLLRAFQTDQDDETELNPPVALFLARGSPANHRNAVGETALHVAARKGILSVIQLLFHASADVNVRNREAETPLFDAVRGRQARALEMLLRQPGVDTTVVSRSGYTARELAVDLCFDNLVALLDDRSLRANEQSDAQKLTLASAGGSSSALDSDSDSGYTSAAGRGANMHEKDTVIPRSQRRSFRGRTTLSFAELGLAEVPLDTILSRGRSLYRVDLSNNMIDSLPVELAAVHDVKLDGNPLLSLPRAVRESPWSGVRQWLKSVQERAQKWKTVKVIVVGEENVGKTTLIASLKSIREGRRMCYAPSTATDGVEVSAMTIRKEKASMNINKLLRGQEDADEENIKYKVFDFAGQDVFYPTHQFFLTSDAVYLVVVNLSNIDFARLEYWIAQIRAVGGNRYFKKAFVVIVGTHTDLMTSAQVQSAVEKIKTRFPKEVHRRIQAVRHVSNKHPNPKDFRALRQTVHVLASEIVETRTAVAPSWVMVHDYLCDEEQKDLQVLRWAEFCRLGRRMHVHPHDMAELTEFLIDSGVTVHFADPTNEICDLVIINPGWLSKLMASIISIKLHTQKILRHGVFSGDDAREMLKAYPEDMHSTLLSVLERYDIVYRLRGESSETVALEVSREERDYFVVPSLFYPDEPPKMREVWPAERPSRMFEHGRVFEFSFFPLFLFGRIFVRAAHLPGCRLLLDACWRNGIVITMDTHRQMGLMRYCHRSLTLSIAVRHSHAIEGATIPASQSLLRMLLELVHTLFECHYPRLLEESQQLVPCTHCLQLNVGRVFHFTKQECLRAARDGSMFLYCNRIRSPSRCVRIDHLAPDLVFADIRQILDKELAYPLGEDSVIGRGGSGVVRLCKYNGRWCASKEPDLTNVMDLEADENTPDDFKFSDFQQEAFMMSQLEHPNIVRLYGVLSHPMQLVLELMPLGDLFAYLHSRDEDQPTVPSTRSSKIPKDLVSQCTLRDFVLDDRQRVLLAMDIARGMHYLHSITPPIVHRDLRSPNIMLCKRTKGSRLKAKIADFGMSRHATARVEMAQETWAWAAPEASVFAPRGQFKYDCNSDVYSFGIVLYELISRKYPFAEYETVPPYGNEVAPGHWVMNPISIQEAIATEGLRPTLPEECYPPLAELVEQCWHAEPSQRPAFAAIVDTLENMHKDMLERNEAQLGMSSSIGSLGSLSMDGFSINVECSEALTPRALTSDELEIVSEQDELIVHSHEIRSEFTATCMTTAEDGTVWVGTLCGRVLCFESFAGHHRRRFVQICHVGKVTDLVAYDGGLVSTGVDAKMLSWHVAEDRLSLRRSLKPFHGVGDYPSKVTLVRSGRQNRARLWVSSATSSVVRVYGCAGNHPFVHEIVCPGNDAVTAIHQHQTRVWVAAGRHLLAYNILRSRLRYQKDFNDPIKSLTSAGTNVYVAHSTEITTVHCRRGKKDAYQFRETEAHSSQIMGLEAVDKYLLSRGGSGDVIVWSTHQGVKPIQEQKFEGLMCMGSHGDVVFFAQAGQLSVWRLLPGLVQTMHAPAEVSYNDMSDNDDEMEEDGEENDRRSLIYESIQAMHAGQYEPVREMVEQEVRDVDDDDDDGPAYADADLHSPRGGAISGRPNEDLVPIPDDASWSVPPTVRVGAPSERERRQGSHTMSNGSRSKTSGAGIVPPLALSPRSAAESAGPRRFDLHGTIDLGDSDPIPLDYDASVNTDTCGATPARLATADGGQRPISLIASSSSSSDCPARSSSPSLEVDAENKRASGATGKETQAPPEGVAASSSQGRPSAQPMLMAKKTLAALGPRPLRAASGGRSNLTSSLPVSSRRFSESLPCPSDDDSASDASPAGVDAGAAIVRLPSLRGHDERQPPVRQDADEEQSMAANVPQAEKSGAPGDGVASDERSRDASESNAWGRADTDAGATADGPREGKERPAEDERCVGAFAETEDERVEQRPVSPRATLPTPDVSSCSTVGGETVDAGELPPLDGMPGQTPSATAGGVIGHVRRPMLSVAARQSSPTLPPPAAPLRELKRPTPGAVGRQSIEPTGALSYALKQRLRVATAAGTRNTIRAAGPLPVHAPTPERPLADSLQRDFLREWLASMGPEYVEYAGAFERHGFADRFLVENITMEDLEYIGVRVYGHKKKMLLFAKRLAAEGEGPQ